MNNTITSSSGQVANVTVRRSECSDAEAIENLLSPEALELFGPINVLQLLEKANLAVTLASEEGDVMAHASFFDHPVTSLVDPPHWESFFCKHLKADALTPWNTLFLHLFVSQTAFSAASFQHIMSAVFNTTAELDFVCLLSSTSVCLDAALDELLEPLQRLTEEEKEEEEEEDEKDKAAAELMAFVCHRRRLCPRLYVRPARVEDHDDVMHIVAQQTKILSVLQRPYFLSELIEAQDKNNHAAVCECDGTITGFISVTAEVDVRRLQEHFDLKHFGGLCKAKQDADDTDDSESDADPHPHEAEKPPQEPQPEPQQEPLEEPESEGQQECQEEDEEVLSSTSDEISGEPNAFCIQFFFSEKNYEIRSLDLIPYIFQLFPDLDFCIITVPTMSLDFPLLQNFLRVPPRPGSLLPSDLYILHRDGLRSVNVRPALESDRDGLADLVRRVRRGRVALLRDLDLLFDNQADAAECPLQAFVADVDGALAGMLIIRDEMDMEYIRARYNIENFIYFSHHGAQEHAQLRHFVLRRCFQHFSRHLFKEALRLARKSSLYHRVYPLGSGREDGCVDHLDFVLDCAVPVRPRRQIIYPLKELGPNAPARSITEEQAPFALNLISRKLTMEPKVTVNARIVLVGASDTGLSFLEVLCFCPHLRFNNLTLISTNGFPADYGPAGIKFLSTSHAYNSREMAQLPLRSCVAEVAAKMVAINRKSKHVVVSSGAKIPYDYLVLCTGLQYQVPCPTQVDQEQPETNEPRKEASFPPRYTGTVPSNFFTLNDPHDCNTARDWLLENFVRKKDNAVVYGNGLDVFTTVEMLLRIGVRGSCIHLVLTPPLRAVANDSPPASHGTNDHPPQSNATDDLPLDDTNDSPRETTVTNDSPPESDVTNDPPPESDVTNYSPRQSDVTSDSPRESDVTDDSPRTTTVTNDSPSESDVTNDPPLESDVTHDSPQESDVINDSPRESDITSDSPRENDVTNESPRESDNDSLRESDITNDPPPETDATTDPLAEIDITDDLPFESDVTNDSPPESDVTNDPPPEIDVTSDSPPEIDDSNDSPREIDDTTESLPESDVTNESPPGSDVTQSSPPVSDVADDSAHRIDVAGSPALENGPSSDPLPDSGVANDPPPEPRVASDSLPKMILSNELPPEPRGLYFSDAGVESAVMAAMTKAQVHIHHDCLLMQMNNGEHPDPLTSVSFSTGSEALHLPCGVFINLSSRGVDYDAFGSINSSFLVFDGRLVIDGAFRTNDAAIWGAGPLTKFSRSYYSDEWSHANFNSKEVGQELATMLLRHFDPTLEAHCEMPSAADRLVPIYKRPKIKGAKLPGRLNYLCVTKPVASRPRGPSVACGRRIATGRPESGDYFCLHLDRNQVVETITCLSLKPLPVHNLMCLYGKHQQLLGQLLVRLQLRQIHDLYSFFRQSWCLAIFHDRFSDFEEELLQGDAEVDCEELQGAAPRDLMKNPSSRAPLRINAAKYLSFNRNLLPMFTCPDDL
ncbi:cilia- and flagella-associated protein 61 isoform X2 [Hippocampus comes]|uniref:cilia- and flagella-associated protein 61 isoform X1 n=1 Tax=Hippocampus comes TaxID=109280 RepID=UPI00094E8DEE|nr:PREDICTED: cilia- and flagella-associated protein 61 isoform X1 [Hippocampus comes]XP_019751818.1 PREDICTED: cilia- and flagella-associated protein 61 isoform X2 [Hippocampus comes]